ncbi:hypothetical protein PC123_g27124 [Phytophthora cactorum]|nr:hypothetical protein PC123_g27124 [Phytophthora cactorum]
MKESQFCPARSLLRETVARLSTFPKISGT